LAQADLQRSTVVRFIELEHGCCVFVHRVGTKKAPHPQVRGFLKNG